VKLTISHAHISSLDTHLHNFLSLRYIDLSHNDFTEFPIFEIPFLQILNLSHNRISHASKVDHLAIEQLDLSNNSIDHFEDLRELITIQMSLRILKLNDNRICSIPNYREKMLEMCPQLQR